MDTRTTNQSRRRDQGSRVLYKQLSGLKLKDPKSLLSSVRAILEYSGIVGVRYDKVNSIVLSSADRFYRDFCNSSVGLGTTQLEQHFDACKRRAKLLTELDQKIQSSNFNDWEEYGIIRRSRDNSSFSPFKGKWENRLTVSYFDSDEVETLFELRISPRCYKPLFLGLYLVIDHISATADMTTLERDNEVIHVVSSLFVSIGNLYTTMRSNLGHARKCVDNTIEKINTPCELDHSENYFTIDYCKFESGPATMLPANSTLNETNYPVRACDVDPFILRNNGFADEHKEISLSVLFSSVVSDIRIAIKLFKEARNILPVNRDSWLKRNYPKDLEYVRDLAEAASTVDFARQYDYDRDSHISMKSSGTTFKGKGLPAFYASQVEKDVYLEESKEFDLFTGYVSDYHTDTCDYVSQGSNIIKSVEPASKIDVRPIYIFDNPQQDRLTWVHNILMDVLNRMDCDCTSRQFKSVLFLLKRTDSNYRIEHRNAVYTLDISDATNTCALEFQKNCLAIFFDSCIVEWWDKTMRHESVVYYPQSNKPYCKTGRKRGQSQGAKSSFPAFALMHHIVYLMSIKLKAWTNRNANAIYRIIGDDSGSSTVDSDRDYSFRNAYIQVCHWMGWDVNPQKGFSAPADSNIAFAEMAKVRILNGRINTPIPPRLLIKGNTSPMDSIALAKWFSNNYLSDKLDIDLVIDNTIISRRNEEYKTFLRKLVAIAPSDAFHGLYSNCEYSDEEEALVLMLMVKTKLESTLVDQILPEHAQTENDRYNRNYSKYKLYDNVKNFHLSGEFWNDPYVQSSPSRKYTRLYNKHEDLIHALKDSLGLASYVADSIMTLKLSSDERLKILSLIDIISAFDKDNLMVVSNNNLRSLSNEVFKILDRYQDRSDVRRELHNAFFADDIIQRMMDNWDKVTLIQKDN